jgi:Zn ribbon nucleic-acid-binding protein
VAPSPPLRACDECGNHAVALRRVDGVEVDECSLCGHLQGDDRAVALVEQRRAARERGLDPTVYPLVLALEKVPTFAVESASGGEAGGGDYPFVFLRLDPQGLADLERLLTVLEMANTSTRRRWVVECALQRGLLFILRPRFWKPVTAITADDVEASRADLAILADVLSRTTAAAWWRERRPPPSTHLQRPRP